MVWTPRTHENEEKDKVAAFPEQGTGQKVKSARHDLLAAASIKFSVPQSKEGRLPIELRYSVLLDSILRKVHSSCCFARSFSLNLS